MLITHQIETISEQSFESFESSESFETTLNNYSSPAKLSTEKTIPDKFCLNLKSDGRDSLRFDWTEFSGKVRDQLDIAELFDQFDEYM